MDENNKQEQENKAEETNAEGGKQNGPRVHLFGAEVTGNGWEKNGDWAQHKAETKEEWRKRKQEWKMQRRAWHDEHGHGGGVFWGMILLFAGVVALLYTMGLIAHPFWQAIAPFWPILLILWGASIILGRHWFARFILFIFALAFLIVIIFYGLVKSDSPLVSSLSPNVVSAIQNSPPVK